MANKFWSYIPGSVSWDLRRQEERQASTTAPLLASLGSSGPAWSTQDMEKFARESYMLNVICYRCIGEIAAGCVAPEWGLYRWIEEGKKRDQVTGNPLSKLLDRPNPMESWEWIVFQAIAH